MKIIIYSFAVIAILVVSSCKTPPPTEEELPQNRLVISKAIAAHGGEKYETSAFSFDFRDWSYTFRHDNGLYEYSRKTIKDGQEILDVMTNDDFKRTIDGKLQKLSEKDISKYRGSLSSVIYFVVLPYKLEDPAVISEYKGTTTIKGQTYETLKVTFTEEGGGEDYQDTYYYWINKETYFVDYFAYRFLVNDGGTRFRSAYNQHNLDGIRFQDYENYKSSFETPLDSLPILYELEKLEKLSVVELENIQVLK